MASRYPGGVPNLADDVFEQIDVDASITQIEKVPPLRRVPLVVLTKTGILR
jgi:hypothetical protein